MFLSREARNEILVAEDGTWTLARIIFKQKLTADTLLLVYTRVPNACTAMHSLGATLRAYSTPIPGVSYRDNSGTIAARGALV